jgi:hypothetical protein
MGAVPYALGFAVFACALGIARDAPAGALVDGGVRSGLSISRLVGSLGDDIGPDHRLGATAGVYARIRIGDRVSIRPELGWVAKGGNSDWAVGSSTGHIENLVDYIELPILVQIELVPAGPLRPYLITGPAFSYRVQDDRRSQGWTVPASQPNQRMALIYEELGTLDDFDVDPFDVGVAGGLGMFFGGGATRFGLESRYTYGLVNVLRGDRSESVRNATFTVTAIAEF